MAIIFLLYGIMETLKIFGIILLITIVFLVLYGMLHRRR